MATPHGSPPPGTCHTELSVENKCTVPGHRAPLAPRGETKGKSNKVKARQRKTTTAKLHRNDNYTVRMPVAIIRWPTADLPVNSD